MIKMSHSPSIFHNVIVRNIYLFLLLAYCIVLGWTGYNILKQRTFYQKPAVFRSTAQRVLNSILSKNWDRLRHDATPNITLLQISRMNTESFSKKQRQDIFPDLIFGEDIEKSSTERATLETLSIAGTKISCNATIQKKQKEWFDKFCEHVISTHTNRPDWIEIGENVTAYDTDLIQGPGIVGKNVSNCHWYIEFTYYKEHWVVNRLIYTTH